MRFAAFAVSALGGLFTLWYELPTAVDVFGGTEKGEWSVVLRILLIIGLLASVLAIVGAVMSILRSPPASILLGLGALGTLLGSGWASGIGVPPACAMLVASFLAAISLRDRRGLNTR